MNHNWWMRIIKNLDYKKQGKLKVDWCVTDIEGDTVLSFLGSTGIVGWVLDFLCAIFPLWWNKGLPVVIGWDLAWRQVSDSVLEAIKERGCKSLKIICHSYGTGVAAHAGKDIYEKLGIKPSLIGFGCVKPVLFGFVAKKYAKCFSDIKLYCHRGDFVSVCPPLPFARHIAKVIWIGESRNLFKTNKWHNDYDNPSHYMYEGNSWWKLPKTL